jgi:hypothetical protein
MEEHRQFTNIEVKVDNIIDLVVVIGILVVIIIEETVIEDTTTVGITIGDMAVGHTIVKGLISN